MKEIRLLGMIGITWEKNKARYCQFPKEDILLYFYDNKLKGYCFNNSNSKIIEELDKLKGKTFEEIKNKSIGLIQI